MSSLVAAGQNARSHEYRWDIIGIHGNIEQKVWEQGTENI